MDPYLECPVTKTKSFTLRLIEQKDSDDLFTCYNDKTAVSFMNDDNCDFGFFVESKEKMAETVFYWIDFYKKKYFVRFSIVDNKTSKVIGTVEGFGGEVGVLRIDIASEYEKCNYISELLTFAQDNFYEYFGNTSLVTKAISEAKERVQALKNNNWKYINTFRNFPEYYQIEIKK